MSTKPWSPPVPDEQMIAEAQTENTMRSIVEWRTYAGGRSRVGLDKDGSVLVRTCGRGPSRLEDDPDLTSQETIETGSQVVGEDDEWA